jgi:hypothetical protein
MKMKTTFCVTVGLVLTLSFLVNITNSNGDTLTSENFKEWGTAYSEFRGDDQTPRDGYEPRSLLMYDYFQYLNSQPMTITNVDATVGNWNSGLLAKESHLVATLGKFEEAKHPTHSDYKDVYGAHSSLLVNAQPSGVADVMTNWGNWWGGVY